MSIVEFPDKNNSSNHILKECEDRLENVKEMILTTENEIAQFATEEKPIPEEIFRMLNIFGHLNQCQRLMRQLNKAIDKAKGK